MTEKTKKKRPPFHEAFAQKVIEQLEAGTAPWLKPWEPGPVNMSPHNPASKVVYQGANRINLSLSGFSDPRWMTLKQANDMGLRIKKGSLSSQIVFYQWTKEEKKLDDDGNPVLDAEGKPEKTTVKLERPIIRTSYVFNGEQIDNMPELELTDKGYEWNPEEKAENILQSSGATIKHDQNDRAFYRTSTDAIHLPPKGNFPTAMGYYETALHELGHWSGHPSRLNREGGPFGSESYAREELRAELASWMLAQDLGISHDPGQHTSYVGNWIEALKKDPLEIVRASRDAEKIKDYVMSLEIQKEVTLDNDIDVEPTVSADLAIEKTPLYVPFEDKDAAKALGAKWDWNNKHWYAPKGTDLEPMKHWLTPIEKAPAIPTLTPEQEFEAALKDFGFDLQGKAPIMDGEIHRVALMDGKGNAKDGAYSAHLDGVPNGWMQNFRTGQKEKWFATGHKLSEEQKLQFKHEQEARKLFRETQRKAEQDLVAQKSRAELDECFLASSEHPYLVKKGIPALDVYETGTGNTLLVPMYNINNELRGLQKISLDGSKYFEKGMEKKGNFHVVGGKDGKFPDKNEEILLAEGYATGASLHMATGKPVAVAFDAGNLEVVAKNIREKFPNAKITICADNDHTQQRNIGIEKAKSAAEFVGGTVKIPTFTKDERAKGLTDFNDLHNSRGLKAVTNQVQKGKGVQQGVQQARSL